jgi:hypothetical protein
MPKCPKCGEEITYLSVRSIDSGIFRIDENGDPEYEWASDIYGDEVIGMEFLCPECREVLFHDVDEAIEFLGGGADEEVEEEG